MSLVRANYGRFSISICNAEGNTAWSVNCMEPRTLRVMKDRCDRQAFNPILHTAWLNNHALTLKRNTAKYYFGEKSSFLHTFLKICCESRNI